MRIAQIAPLYESIPPRLYGGTELVVSHLTETLVDMGHDVTLFATGDTQTRARLHKVCDCALRLDSTPLKSDLACHMCLLDEVRQHADEFDILHFHTDILHFPFFEHSAWRTLTTLHGRLDMKGLSETFRRWQCYPLVSISRSQRSQQPGANWCGTVHHGLRAAAYPFQARPKGGYLAFLGRVSPEKRPDRAIAIARRAGLPLKIAAKVDDADRAYFEREIRPLLDQPGVEFVGEIGAAEKAEFLGNALALLFPIDWPEPFGLVMIEAMACGTPVIAWRCGSVPEVLDHGLSGFIVESEAQACKAIARLPGLDRHRVRERFEQRFRAETMAEHYLELYWSLLDKRPTKRALRKTA